MNQKLQQQIENKLETLATVIQKIRNKVIEPHNCEMWDSSYYYNLTELLKEALAELENKQALQELDLLGEPLILETGLCSLLDDWETEQEKNQNI